MILIALGRSGTSELRGFYLEQLEGFREMRKSITARLKAQPTLSLQQEMTYYSVWHYAAIHVLLSVSGFSTPARLASHLGLSEDQVSECLGFLEATGLAVCEKGEYRIGKTRIHLGKNSPMRARHHSNWRLRAMQALDKRRPEDLFFSSIYSLSESDAKKVRALLVETIEKAESVILPSKEEAVFCFSSDFFRI